MMDPGGAGEGVLVADVGNTETVLGVFSGSSLEVSGSWRLATATPRTVDELGVLVRALLREGGVEPGALSRATIGSVVPGFTGTLRTALERVIGGPVSVVDASTPLPIRLAVEEPRSVGADRVVNTLAAVHLYGCDTVVVDLGTATTYDCITAGGEFVGGVIAPGILAGEEWLARRTAKLPRVDFRPPDRVIGRRTETCLHSGIFYSAVDAMDGIVRRILDEWGRPDALVVATGGLAAQVAPHSCTVRRIEPHLTLIGLELAGRHVASPGAAG